MYRYCLFITVFFLSLSAQFGFARQSLKDYGGYKDPALFTRMPHYYLPNSGSVEELQYQAYEFYVTSGNRSEKKRIEGRFSRHTYEYDEKAAGARPSSLQIIRNYQAAAKQIGGQILFDDGSRTTILFEKEGKETWVEVLPRNQGYLYHVRMVEREGMKQDVVANADVFKAGLQQSGHVEVPGIFFDTGRSVVKPESDAAL